MLVTVFTPVYNRAYAISQLYHSLCRQTCQEFEWLVVNDGSTDNIDELMATFQTENKITIRYYSQPNGGKHRAINRGVKEAKGELFFIVDSDDYLTDDAVEWIITTATSIVDDHCYAGISGIRIKPDGTKIGGGKDFGTIDANALSIRLDHGVRGDLAEVYKTDVLKHFPFPEFNGEKFCPEALIWNRIARQGLIRYCHKGIYVCEYLPDGLTAKITAVRKKSPAASMTYYSELFHTPGISLFQKVKAAINYWRFADSSLSLHTDMNSILSLSCMPLAWLMRLKDNKQS